MTEFSPPPLLPFGDWLLNKPRNGYYKAKKFVGPGTKYFRMGDLFKFDRVSSTTSELQEMECTPKEVVNHRLVRDELLFCRTSVAAAGIGKCSIVTDASESVIPASNLIRATVNRALADPRFVYFYFSSDVGGAELRSRTRGAAVFTITGADIAETAVPNLDLASQQAAADVLWNIDDLIENNRRRVVLLEDIARAIYREWFVLFRYPSHGGVALLDSPFGPMPHGWTTGVLGDLAELDRPNIQPTGSPTELFDHYSIPAFDDDQRPAVDTGASIRSGKYLLSSPAILVSKLNPRIDRVWFAEPGSERRSVTSTEFLLLRPSQRSNLEHLYLLTRDPGFRDQLTGLSGGTSGSHQRAKPADFLSIPVAVPPAPAMGELSATVKAHLRLARRLRLQTNQLADLRDLLLPKLVTGQIDVSLLDVDGLLESASS